ncbi:extracellular solute-binding protein [Paenibacillus sp. HJGM_3]|uniref:extracellular solute-binding protein n=1 Tax=Paenibacillus sp. HJGM_3 TaxID=3379816 RepID=UPI00385E8D58
MPIQSRRIDPFTPVRAALALLLLLGAGCSQAPSEETKKPLRIPYYDEQNFQSVYGDYFAVKFPDVEVEVIPMNTLYQPGVPILDVYSKMIDELKPDLLLTNVWDYEKLAAANKLVDLTPFVKKSRFDLDEISPAAIDLLKSKGQNKLLGLAPQFTSTALYYNKDLFDRYQIPYPHDKMTWEETMLLARRFPVNPNVDERIYGIHEKYRTAFDWVNDIAATNGLTYVSADGQTITMDSPAWLLAFRTVIEGFRSGNLYYYDSGGKPINYGPTETMTMDLFSAGRAAMMISGTEQMMRMKQRGAKLNWDVVTVPVDPSNPDVTRNLSVGTIFSIAAKAEHADTAWEVVQYFNSAEAAKVGVKTSDSLSTRLAFAKDPDGRSLDAFYKLKRDDRNASGLLPVPVNFIPSFELIVGEEIDLAVKGTKSVEEAVKSIGKRAQALLTKANAEQASS